MNERIKELAREAGIVVDFSESPYSELSEISKRKHLEVSEKFTELIVQECIEICENKTDHLDHKMFEVWRGALACASDIKQHFEVEE